MKKDYIPWYRHGWYRLYSDGKIQKPDGYLSDGKSWEFIGLLKIIPFGRYGEFIKREDCFKIPEKELYYKNGKPRYHVVDIDHGSQRIWSQ